MAFSQRLYDHWKVAVLLFLAVSIADSVVQFLRPTYADLTLTLIVEFALALIWFPGFLYIFGEFVRLWSGSDGSSKRLTKILLIGFALFFGSGVAIPHVYDIAFDAFRITLPTSSILDYLLNAGDLAGNLTLGIGAVYARGVGVGWADIPEPEKPKSMRAWLIQGLEPIGFSMFVLGFVIGFGPMAFAAFVLIVAGAVLFPIGYVIRKSAVSKS